MGAGSVIELSNEDDLSSFPQEFTLLSPSPNPFNPSTLITFGIINDERISVDIFDIQGQLVNTLINKNLQAGWHTINWDGKNKLKEEVPSGIYIVSIKAMGERKSKKLILQK